MSDSRPDDDEKSQPQVIDLDTTDFKTEDEARETPAPEADEKGVEAEDTRPAAMPPYVPAKRKKSRTWAWIIAALLAGAIGGGWLYRDLLSNYLPTAQMTAMQGRLDALEANGKTMSEQLLAVSQASDSATASVAAADGMIKSTASGLAEASSRLDGLQTRIATAETALKSARADLDSLNSTVASIGSGASTGTGTGAADPAALAALNQRIAALEKDVASLKAAPGGGDKAALVTALSQALADLKAKIAAGASFQAEYDSISRVVPAAAGLDVLAAHAAEGVPSPAGLAKALRDAIPSLPQPATPAPASDSWTGWLLESLSGIVTIRDIGESDWPLLAEKAAALAESGDLTQAIAIVDAAEGTKPVPLSQWRDQAAARLALEAALVQVSDSVMRQISAAGGMQ